MSYADAEFGSWRRLFGIHRQMFDNRLFQAGTWSTEYHPELAPGPARSASPRTRRSTCSPPMTSTRSCASTGWTTWPSNSLTSVSLRRRHDQHDVRGVDRAQRDGARLPRHHDPRRDSGRRRLGGLRRHGPALPDVLPRDPHGPRVRAGGARSEPLSSAAGPVGQARQDIAIRRCPSGTSVG